MGDFNSVPANALDIISGHNHNIDTVRKFNRWVKQLNVYDICQLKNSTEKRFTWIRNKISRRLDYIFLGETLQSLASDSYIKGYGFSDHSVVLCSLSFSPRPKTSTPYKLNCKLLANENYINIIKKHIEQFTGNPTYDLLNFHMKWELLKAEIKVVSQQFSRFFFQSNKHNHTTNLRDLLNDLEKQLSNDPSDKYLQNEIN